MTQTVLARADDLRKLCGAAGIKVAVHPPR
jgi:hypothetical protein